MDRRVQHSLDDIEVHFRDASGQICYPQPISCHKPFVGSRIVGREGITYSWRLEATDDMM